MIMTMKEYTKVWCKAQRNVFGFNAYSEYFCEILWPPINGSVRYPWTGNILSDLKNGLPILDEDWNLVEQLASPDGKTIWQAYCAKHGLDPELGYSDPNSKYRPKELTIDLRSKP